MLSINCKVKPNTFKRKLSTMSKEFYGWNQNDSQECLSLILDTIHEETKTDVKMKLKPMPEDIEQFVNVKNHYTNLLTNTDDTDKRITIKYVFFLFRSS